MVSLEERLRRRLVVQADCHVWSGACRNKGYGVVRFGGRNSPLLATHRLAYELWVGPIPEGLNVLHRCDNPPCCNPAHLFLGTHEDNMRDMVTKGRGRAPHGTASPRCRHSEEVVAAIRAAAGSTSWAELGRRFGVDPSYARRLASGERRAVA